MRHVYRATGENPRPNASGRQNVVGVGAVTIPPGSQIECPSWGCGPTSFPPRRGFPIYPVYPVGPEPFFPYRFFGNTTSVPQPPPGQVPGSVVANPNPLPLSPTPSPTVPVPPAQTAPSLPNPGTTLSSTGSSPSGWIANQSYAIGQAIVDSNGHTQQVIVAGTSGPSMPNFNDAGGSTSDGSAVWRDLGPGGAVASSGIGTWLTESTLISGIPNWGLAGAAAVLLFMMSKKR